MEVGKWIRKHLSQDDFEKISNSVLKAESGTSGEIIPMIVRRSTNVDHVPVTLALILTIVLMEADILIFSGHVGFYSLPIFLLMSACVAWPLSKLAIVQRWLTPKLDRILDVNQRAELEFYRGRFNHTSKQTGVLIFLSMMEKRAVVLGDKPIAAKLGEKDWQVVVDALTAKIKAGDLAGGMNDAIEKAGQILHQHFPADGHNADELPNSLIIKD